MGRKGRKEGRKGKRRPFRKNKANQKNNSNQKKKLFKSQNRDPKDLKKTIMHRGRESQSAIYNKQQSCSAVQCSPSYRAYVLRESSGLSRKGCEPRIPCSEIFLIFPLLSFPLFFFLPFFLSFFPPNFPDFCFVICYSALFCTCTLCFCFGGGRVKLGTGEEGWDAWADGSMAQQLAGGLERRRREGKSRRASVLCFFLPFTYFFLLPHFSKSNFTFCFLSEGVLFCLSFFLHSFFGLFEFNFFSSSSQA